MARDLPLSNPPSRVPEEHSNMTISKKDLRQVKRQIHAARVEELTKALEEGDQQKLDQLNTGPTKREQMNQARMAARQTFREKQKQSEAEALRAVKNHIVAQPAPVMKFNIAEGSLVTLSKNTIGFRLGVEMNPYIPLQKGDVGVLMYRDLVSRGTASRGRGRRGTPLCHVMMGGSIVEMPLSVIRAAADDDEAEA